MVPFLISRVRNLKHLKIICIYVCVWGVTSSECWAQGGKVKKVLDLLELGLQGLESPLTWVFGTKHRLSAILTTEALPQVQHRNFKKKKKS